MMRSVWTGVWGMLLVGMAIGQTATPTRTPTCTGVFPVNGGVDPDSGSYTSATVYLFSSTHTDGDGATDIALARILFNNALVGANSLYLQYDRAVDLLYLRDDGNTTWGTGYAPGSANSLSNSQGTLHCATSEASADGDVLTVTWAVEFGGAWCPGLGNIWIGTIDACGRNPGWTDVGDSDICFGDTKTPTATRTNTPTHTPTNTATNTMTPTPTLWCELCATVTPGGDMQFDSVGIGATPHPTYALNVAGEVNASTSICATRMWSWGYFGVFATPHPTIAAYVNGDLYANKIGVNATPHPTYRASVNGEIYASGALSCGALTGSGTAAITGAITGASLNTGSGAITTTGAVNAGSAVVTGALSSGAYTNSATASVAGSVQCGTLAVNATPHPTFAANVNGQAFYSGKTGAVHTPHPDYGVNTDAVRTDRLLIPAATPPAGYAATGTAGEIIFSSTAIWYCYAANTWSFREWE